MNDTNIRNITKTIEISRRLLDFPAMLRNMQLLTHMLPKMNLSQRSKTNDMIMREMGHAFHDKDNSLNYLLIRQCLSTLRYFLSQLKDIAGDQYYLSHKILRYTGRF